MKMHNSNYIFFLYFIFWIEFTNIHDYSRSNRDLIGHKMLLPNPFSLLLIHFKFSTLLHPTTISPPFAYSSSPSSEHFSISILCSLIQLSSARSTKNLISRFLYTPLGPKSIKISSKYKIHHWFITKFQLKK